MPTSTISKAKIAANKRGVSGSLHTFRCGHPAASLIDEMPEGMISDQMDMSSEVLREHCNEQTKADKRRLQQRFLNG